MKTEPDFLVLKKLPLNTRFCLFALLAISGIAVQLFGLVVPGLVLVLVASALGITRSRFNKPKKLQAGEWRTVTMDEIQDARKLALGSEELVGQQGPFHLGSCIGCGTLIAVAMSTWIAVVVIGMSSHATDPEANAAQLFSWASTAVTFGLDAVILLLPLWMFGRVTPWQPPNLSLRLEQLWFVYQKASADPALQFEPSLQVAKTEKGSVPLDCRLMVKTKDTSSDFMGIQVQTAINSVRGSSYPYTYCVLIAKPGLALLEKARAIIEMPPKGGFSAGWLADANTKKEAKLPRYQSAVLELEREKDVELVVVRQATGGQGYTTSPQAASDIFSVAYSLARNVLEA